MGMQSLTARQAPWSHSARYLGSLESGMVPPCGKIEVRQQNPKKRLVAEYRFKVKCEAAAVSPQDLPLAPASSLTRLVHASDKSC